MFSESICQELILINCFHHSFSLGLSFEECRPGDSLFIRPRVSLEINDSTEGSRLNRTVGSPSESNCFSKCNEIAVCKSATFFKNDRQCLLRDTNRFGVRNRIKRINDGIYFEKTEGCSRLARARRRVIGAVKNAVDCKDVLKRGWKEDGVYVIQHSGEDHFRPIRCRMSILGGGWTVVQRRVDGSISFEGDWERYKHGFGEVSREFWYGNENIHNLTKNGDNEIIFELQGVNGLFYHPFYQQFKVDSEYDQYKLTVGAYEHKYGRRLPEHPSQTDGFDFVYNNQMKFSTIDRDNDDSAINCAVNYRGMGWWFNTCSAISINDPLFGVNGMNSMKWEQITGSQTQTKPLKSTEMMIRRK